MLCNVERLVFDNALFSVGVGGQRGSADTFHVEQGV